MSKNLKYQKSWEKGMVYRLEKDGEKTIYLSTNYNSCYGDLIVNFQIGDETHDTGVKCKYSGNILSNMECNSLCGEREFEKGSITYEFLYKPLGLSVENVPATGKDGWDKIYASFYFVKRQLEERGYVLIYQ